MEIDLNLKALFPGRPIVEILETEDIDDLKPIRILDLLDSQGQQQNEDDQEEGAIDDPDYESIGYVGNLNPEVPPRSENVKFKKINMPSDNDLGKFTRTLVPEQMNVLRKVVASCKAIIRNKERVKNKLQPIHLIIHGGPGNSLIFKQFESLSF